MSRGVVHEIIIGDPDIGSVYNGTDELKARDVFNEHVDRFHSSKEIADAPSVVWLQDGSVFETVRAPGNSDHLQ